MLHPPVTYSLEPSASYQVQAVLWTRVTLDGFKVCGIMEILQSKKAGNKVYSSRYAIQELDPSHEDRRFQITKPGGKEHYTVSLKYPTFGHDECGCKGYESGKLCKHVHGLRVLWGKGELPGLPQPPKVKNRPTTNSNCPKCGASMPSTGRCAYCEEIV